MNRKTLLQELLDSQFGGSQADFARAIKRSPAQVHQWLSGYRMIGDAAVRHIEMTLGLATGWMDGNKGVTHLPDTGYITFDLLQIEPCGNGQVSNHSPFIRPIQVSETWAHTVLGGDLSRIRLFSAKGISMQPTIDNNDVLFVDQTVRHYDGDGLYVIVQNGDTQVRRLQKLHADTLTVISDNPTFITEKLTGNIIGTLVICGRVLAAWSLKRFW